MRSWLMSLVLLLIVPACVPRPGEAPALAAAPEPAPPAEPVPAGRAGDDEWGPRHPPILARAVEAVAVQGGAPVVLPRAYLVHREDADALLLLDRELVACEERRDACEARAVQQPGFDWSPVVLGLAGGTAVGLILGIIAGASF